MTHYTKFWLLKQFSEKFIPFETLGRVDWSLVVAGNKGNRVFIFKQSNNN